MIMTKYFKKNLIISILLLSTTLSTISAEKVITPLTTTATTTITTTTTDLTKIPLQLLIEQAREDNQAWQKVLEGHYRRHIPEHYHKEIDLSRLNIHESMNFDEYKPAELMMIFKLGNNQKVNEDLFQYISNKAHTDSNEARFYQNLLGIMLYKGIGVEKSFEMALAYFEMSVSEGLPEAKMNCYEMFLKDFSLGESFTKNPFVYLKEAAAEGNTMAMFKLANLMLYPLVEAFCIENDYEISAEKKKINKEYQKYLQKTGQGRENEDRDPIDLLTDVANENCPDAQYLLSTYMSEGVGCEKDIREARKWVHLAADNGSFEAQTDLAGGYFEGIDNLGGINYINAFKYAYQAAHRDNAEAQFILGSLYNAGLGLTEDNTEVLRWYRQAAQNGHKKAKVIVRELDCFMSDPLSEEIDREFEDFMSDPLPEDIGADSSIFGFEDQLAFEKSFESSELETISFVLKEMYKTQFSNANGKNLSDKERAFLFLIKEFYDFVAKNNISLKIKPKMEKLLLDHKNDLRTKVEFQFNFAEYLEGELLYMKGKGEENKYLQKMVAELYRRAAMKQVRGAEDKWMEYS